MAKSKLNCLYVWGAFFCIVFNTFINGVTASIFLSVKTFCPKSYLLNLLETFPLLSILFTSVFQLPVILSNIFRSANFASSPNLIAFSISIGWNFPLLFLNVFNDLSTLIAAWYKSSWDKLNFFNAIFPAASGFTPFFKAIANSYSYLSIKSVAFISFFWVRFCFRIGLVPTLIPFGFARNGSKLAPNPFSNCSPSPPPSSATYCDVPPNAAPDNSCFPSFSKKALFMFLPAYDLGLSAFITALVPPVNGIILTAPWTILSLLSSA